MVAEIAATKSERPRGRFQFRMRTVFYAVVIAAAAFGLARFFYNHDAGPVTVEFAEPEFGVTGLNHDYYDNPGFRVVLPHDGAPEKVVVHVPQEMITSEHYHSFIQFSPDLRAELIDTTSFFSFLHAPECRKGVAVQLSWSGQRLAPANGFGKQLPVDDQKVTQQEAVLEHYVSSFSGYFDTDVSVREISPTTLELTYRLAYRRLGRELEPVYKDVKVIVEVVPVEGKRE